MVDYPKCFLKWLKKTFDMKYKTLEECKQSLGGDYEEYKKLYRLSDEKRHLNILDGSKKVFRYLDSKDFTIWVITTRPKMENVLCNTVYWMVSNELLCDNLIFTEDKEGFINSLKQLTVLIDDDKKLLKKYGNTSILCFNEEWDKTLDGLKRVYNKDGK